MSPNRILQDILDNVLAGTDTDRATGTRLQRETMRLLAHGKPITLDQLAAATGVPTDDLANAPAGQDIEYDDQGRIVGWGLTLEPTPHRLTINDHHLFAWCAGDPIGIPLALQLAGAIGLLIPRLCGLAGLGFVGIAATSLGPASSATLRPTPGSASSSTTCCRRGARGACRSGAAVRRFPPLHGPTAGLARRSSGLPRPRS